MPKDSPIQLLAHAVADRMFEDFLDLRYQGTNYTWERGTVMAGKHAAQQLALSYGRAPKDLNARMEQAKAWAVARFQQRMADYGDVLPVHSRQA